MTSAERLALKILVDQATRAALNGQRIHAARLHRGIEHSPGSTLNARPVCKPTKVNDQTWDDTVRIPGRKFKEGCVMAKTIRRRKDTKRSGTNRKRSGMKRRTDIATRREL